MKDNNIYFEEKIQFGKGGALEKINCEIAQALLNDIKNKKGEEIDSRTLIKVMEHTRTCNRCADLLK